VFTTPRAIVIVVCAAAVLFSAGAVFAIVQYGLRSWMTWVFVGLSLFGLAGIAESLVQRVELDHTHLHIRTLRGHRSYERGQIRKVWEAKGSPSLLELADGTRVELPGVGSYLGNSIRAWIKRGSA
jgi:hypothetical protein